MSRYNTGVITAPRVTAIQAGSTPVVNHAGGVGYVREAKSELFLSASTSFTVDKFYESESDLRQRQRVLVQAVASEDPEWTFNFLTWLRTEANIRTGALVLAADAVHGRLASKADNTKGWNRRLINAVLKRPDEPGEMLAYWISQYGRNIPKPVKRGVADAARRLYTEKSFLKYDSSARAFRFGDVIEMTHPDLYVAGGRLSTHIIDSRHGNEASTVGLPILAANRELRSLPAAAIIEMANDGTLGQHLAQAGMTWEDVPSLVIGAWTGKLWDAIIPSMGAMALIRNLRNFDQAGISDESYMTVCDALVDPIAIQRSRMLPLRMLTAYKNITNVRWAYPLEKALDLTLANVPHLPGSTLILVDLSGSMSWSGGSPNYAEQAMLFGGALALRAHNPTLVQYGSSARELEIPKGGSLLPLAANVPDLGGTQTEAALRHYHKGHDRVVLLTDEQSYGRGASTAIPANVPMITFNLAGYGYGDQSGPNRMTLSSLSDSSWKLVDQWGNPSDKWPWEK